VIRENIQVVLAARVETPHAVNPLNLLVNAAECSECLWAVRAEMVRYVVVTVEVGVDGWHAPVHVQHSGKGLNLAEHHVGGDVEKRRWLRVCASEIWVEQAVDISRKVAEILPQGAAGDDAHAPGAERE